MISFKQFLYEEDETDQEHESVQSAAMEYMKRCSQFPDAKHPLYRISGEFWERPKNHTLRTRVPRTRKSASIGGTAAAQEFLFSQPGWEGYPSRRQSIFCSTTPNFVVGDAADDGHNLLMIYPFDGVKIAVLPEEDLNTMNVTRGFKSRVYTQLDDLLPTLHQAYEVFVGTDSDTAETLEDRIALIKKTFNKGGRFDPEANGNDEMADALAEMERDGDFKTSLKLLRMVATELPEALTPEAMGVKLVKSRELDLPGETRECWFSGKYLSVPARYHKEFLKAVDLLEQDKYHDNEEPPDE